RLGKWKPGDLFQGTEGCGCSGLSFVAAKARSRGLKREPMRQRDPCQLLSVPSMARGLTGQLKARRRPGGPARGSWLRLPIESKARTICARAHARQAFQLLEAQEARGDDRSVNVAAKPPERGGWYGWYGDTPFRTTNPRANAQEELDRG